MKRRIVDAILDTMIDTSIMKRKQSMANIAGRTEHRKVMIKFPLFLGWIEARTIGEGRNKYSLVTGPRRSKDGPVHDVSIRRTRSLPREKSASMRIEKMCRIMGYELVVSPSDTVQKRRMWT